MIKDKYNIKTRDLDVTIKRAKSERNGFEVIIKVSPEGEVSYTSKSI